MNPLHATIIGIVEGLTEFLPISSTYHQILASKLLQIPETDFIKLFQVFIQSGAILAALILNFKILISNLNLDKKVIVSFLPTAIIGLIFHKIIKSVFFESNLLMISASVLVGLIFIALEAKIKKGTLKLDRSVHQLTYHHAIIAGLAQSFAIIPGVSRSGAVMVALMAMGYQRRDAATYSFILAIPTLFAASALDLFKNRQLLSQSDSISLLFVGSFSAFISALFVIKWFTNFLQHHNLIPFAYYRLLLAIPTLFII